MWRRLALAAAVAPSLATQLAADIAAPLPAACLDPRETVMVARASPPLSLELADGRTVRLGELAAPTGRALQEVMVAPSAAGTLLPYAPAVPQHGRDRYARVVGDIVLKDTGASLSVSLLEAGLAVVDPAVMSEACLAPLFAAERRAESAGRGVWSEGWVMRAADPSLAEKAGRYAVVEGTVASVGETRRTIYLNFGKVYRTDFTALIRRSDARGWADGLVGLGGERVRVRGVLEAWQGGLIRIEHPAQLERLAAPG